MNPECRLNSMHALPRPRQPRRMVSPPKYAAAGDAPRDQISPDSSLVTPTEIFAIDKKSLLTTPSKNNSRARSKLNDKNAGQILTFSNDPLETVNSVTDNDSSSTRFMPIANLAELEDKKSRFASKPHGMEDISLCREPPCKEYSQNTPRASNHENLADSEPTTLALSKLTKVIATNEEGIDLRNTDEDCSAKKILSPDRKISMFSKEIWTERILPIDTFVCPEPELVEIYFDKKKITHQSKSFENYSAESIDSSPIWKNNNRGVLGRNILTNPPTSVRRDKTPSSGQKTINFDDEIWPVCPKLIPSGNELSISSLESRHKAISPEKFNENLEEVPAMTRPPCSKFKLSSRSSRKQYDPEVISRSEQVIEPTHEIECQNDWASRSEAGNFCGNNYSRSAISQANVAAVDEPRRLDNADRNFRERNPVVNILDRTESDDFCDELPKLEPLDELMTSPRLTQVSRSRQEMRTNFESRQARISKKNPLSVSNSEPVSMVLRDNLNRREIDSLYEAKLPALSCSEVTSLDNMKVKQNKEDFGSSEVDESSQLLVFDSRNKMQETSVELNSKNQDTCRGIHVQENHVRPFTAASPSKLPATESRDVQESVNKQKIEKKRKCVRFKTGGQHGDAKCNSTGAKLQENSENLDFESTNDTLDCISVENFKQEIDQLANQIAGQIETDPVLDDAVVTLAKVEIIMEANRQTVERLQQLQPNFAISKLTPPDAGKSIAKAIIRCRNYMQSNGYSRDSTSTINKLLTSTVQNLKLLVERQKLVLALRTKKRCAAPVGRRQSKRLHEEGSLNNERILTAEEFGVYQVQCLISDVLALTEQIVPKLNREEGQRKSSVASRYSHSGAKKSTKNRRTMVDTVAAEKNDTGSPKPSKVTLEAQASRATEPFGVPELDKAEEAVETYLEAPMVFSEASSNPRMGSDQQNLEIRKHQRTDKELQTTQSPITRCTNSKKITSTESTKTLKKLFNELWEKRSKTLPRHYNVNDSTSSFRSLAGSHNATINQKPPVWKPGGSNSVQPSISIVQNNQKIRLPPSSSVNKKKNTIGEHTRDRKPHQRTKATPGITNDSSKILEKSITEPHNVTSLAKIRTDPARRHHSEVLSLGRSKVQIAAEINETRTRKPRSKSRTRTKTPNKIPRITVTEIPLEHANYCPQITEQEAPVVEGLTLAKKTASSPKEIMQMLEELIKSSGNETATHNNSSVQIVGRCNVSMNDVNQGIDPSALLKTEVKLITDNDLTSSNEQGDHRAEESSQNQSIQLKSIEEIVKKFKNTDQINDNEILDGGEKASVQDTLAKSYNPHKELDSTATLNAEDMSTVSRTNSEATSNRSSGGKTAPFVSNISYTAELSSEHSIGSVFSKYCQASLTSLTSHENSEELISSKISDTGTSCCEETQEDSNQSFNTVENDEVMRENCTQESHKDQTASSNSGVITKKKFVNRHARSLEMLKEILSDQGLGIHLLSRAENELRDKCKCSSSKRELTTRRSLHSANITSSRFSGDPVTRLSFLDRNLSTTLCSKLATLSESEHDVEHVEVATMTSANASVVGTDFNSYCSIEDKTVLGKVVTVENATQFDITTKSDMCVGDGTVCDTRGPFIIDTQDNFTAPYTSSATFRPSSLADETFKCKLPDEILDAFRLAATRATNFYTAVDILRGNMLSETIIRENHNPVVNPDKNLLNAAKMESGHVRHLSEAFSSDTSIKLTKQSEKRNSTPAVRIIIPRIPPKVNSEVTKISSKESPREKVPGKNIMTVKESSGRITAGELRSTSNLDRGNLNKPVVPPKPILTRKKAVVRKTVVKEQIIDPNEELIVENRSTRHTEYPQSAEFMQMKVCQSSSSNQKSLIKERVTGERIETLHFAGRQTASVVGDTANTRCESLNANFGGYGSPKVGKGMKDSFAGSRIKTLLEENLQRFKTDFSPMVDGKVFTNFEDQILTQSSDDEVLADEVFTEATTSTSCIRLDDCNIFSEVKTLLNCLLNAVEKNRESSTMTEQHGLNTHSPRHHRLRRHVVGFKSVRAKRTVKRSILCDNFWNNLSGIIVSREHLLSLIYAVICSVVFCCLQLSVHCEV